MAPRRAGQHARETTRRLARRSLATIVVLVAAAAAVAAVAGFRSATFVGAEVTVIGALAAIARFELPLVDRWDRGAAGEERVGALLGDLEREGWHLLHDVDTGRGNVDTIAIGPGGIFTIEVKSHRGRRRRRPDRAAHARPGVRAEEVAGADQRARRHRAARLLARVPRRVVGRPVSRRRGVTVLPARMLVDHLRRYPSLLSPADASAFHARLVAAVDAARGGTGVITEVGKKRTRRPLIAGPPRPWSPPCAAASPC